MRATRSPLCSQSNNVQPSQSRFIISNGKSVPSAFSIVPSISDKWYTWCVRKYIRQTQTVLEMFELGKSSIVPCYHWGGYHLVPAGCCSRWLCSGVIPWFDLHLLLISCPSPAQPTQLTKVSGAFHPMIGLFSIRHATLFQPQALLHEK